MGSAVLWCMRQPVPMDEKSIGHGARTSVERRQVVIGGREKLWDLLQFVISDPKSDSVPAKRKLIEINLGKAASATQGFLTDIIAKYLAQMSGA